MRKPGFCEEQASKVAFRGAQNIMVGRNKADYPFEEQACSYLVLQALRYRVVGLEVV